MANMPLVGGVTSIDNVPLTTTAKVSLKRSRTVTQKFGAVRPDRERARLRRRQIERALELELTEIDTDALSARDEGFSFQYQKGAKRYITANAICVRDRF